MAPIMQSNDKLDALADEHRRWLSSFDPLYLEAIPVSLPLRAIRCGLFARPAMSVFGSDYQDGWLMAPATANAGSP